MNPNPNDAGGGLFGFPQLASRPYANWTPLQQLDTVQHYIQGWMKKVGIESFPSPADFYVLVRGPYGLAPENYDNDEFDMVGLTLGKVRKIYWDHVYNSYGWTPDKFPGRGPDIGLVGETWNVRIGAWTGKFGFDSAGSVWYASYPAAQSYFGRDGRLTASAEPEIDRSARNYGHWHSEGDKVRWRFQPVSDIRRFEVTLPVNPRVTMVNVSPAGQGTFEMWRGAEPA